MKEVEATTPPVLTVDGYLDDPAMGITDRPVTAGQFTAAFIGPVGGPVAARNDPIRDALCIKMTHQPGHAFF